MKVFSFFNGKGGTGKTTLTIMLASFLAYYLGLRVCVVDMEKSDYRIDPFRKAELNMLGTKGTPIANYAIRSEMPDPSDYYTIENSGLTNHEYSPRAIQEMVNTIRNEKNTKPYDIILIDFPARFEDGCPVHVLAREGVLDGVYVPMRLESQERRSACRTALGIAQYGVNTKLLWNDVDSDIIRRKEPLDKAEEEVKVLEKYGVTFSPTRIKRFKKAMQEVDAQMFVRTTLCWPERYVSIWCPELKILFNEIAASLGIKKS